MASLRPRVRLLDIRNEITGIPQAIHGLAPGSFGRDWVVLRAVQHALLIIGEAARAIPDDIPWARISALGNYLRHEYASIDTRRIWDVVGNHFQPLNDAATEILRSLDDEPLRPHVILEMRPMTNHFGMLAAYNRWANGHLYDAAAKLTDAQYREDRGAFFKSVHGTLNHLLATDRIWMRRFTGEGEAPDRLDAILHDALPALQEARQAEDDRIQRYVAGLDGAALAGTFRYRRVSTPEMFEQPLAPALLHLFNHQTHHRGQVHCMLTGLVGEAPSLDLLFFQRESGLGMS